MTTAQEFLESSSGESYPAFKFEKVGDTVKGTIMTEPRPIERPSLKDGSPEKQLPINLDVEGVGPQTVWCRAGFMAGAIADAVKEAGAPGLQIGGVLAIRFTEERDTGKPNKAKVFKAKYEAPASNGVSVDEIF